LALWIVVCLWVLDELVEDCAFDGRGVGLGREIVVLAVVGEFLPALESVGALEYLFLELLIGVLVVAQGFLALGFVHENRIGLVLILLVVSGLEIALFCVALLQVELLLELDVSNVRVHLYHVIPKLLLLVESLLDLPHSHVR
jgi:hypothetical protein